MSDASAKSESAEVVAPSHVRYWIVVLATLMAVLLYLDRYCTSFTVPFIREELSLSDRQASWLLSAFFITYGLAQVPTGWLSDRYGSRLMLTVYILMWSAMTGVMGMAGSFLLVMIFRMGVGLGQAGAYPTGALMVAKWMPYSQRGLASGIISMGGRLGAVLAPILTAYLLIAFLPADKPPRLSPDDVFNSARLCKDLTQPHKKKPHVNALTKEMRSHFSDLVNEIIEKCAAENAAPPSEAELKLVVDELNSRTWYDSVDAEDFDLPPISDSSLSAQESEKRNRALLENAYPNAIRKLEGLGWRPTFLVYGAIGIVIALVFWLAVRDTPAQHPLCNNAEVMSIGGVPAGSPGKDRPVGMPLGLLLKSRSLWFSSLQQLFTNFGWLFITTLLPRYLIEVHHVPVKERGWMTSVPIALGSVGMVCGGWLTDWLTHRLGKYWGRCLPMTVTRFMAMSAYVVCIFLDSPWQVTLMLGAVAIATDLGTPAVWAFNQDIGGRYVGSALGWGNMWGNIGAFLAPIILNEIIAGAGWKAMFFACAAAFFLSGLAGFGIDARIPLAPKEVEKELPS